LRRTIVLVGIREQRMNFKIKRKDIPRDGRFSNQNGKGGCGTRHGSTQGTCSQRGFDTHGRISTGKV